MNWQIGDRALIIGSQKGSSHVGKTTMIVGPYAGSFEGWLVDLPPSSGTGQDGYAMFLSKYLRLIPPDEEASWEAIEKATGWRPKELEHVLSN